MAKNPKQSKESPAPESNPAAASNEPRNGSGTAKQPVTKKAADPAGRAKAPGGSSGPSPRKALVGRTPRTKTTRQSAASDQTVITDEKIRMRAYFISEWRLQNGIAGDSAKDWLDAKRQLQEEAGQRN